MHTVAVIDYGMGNLRSVAKAVEHVAPAGTRVLVTDRPEHIHEADRIVFPGQGAARDCMRALREHGLVDTVRAVATDRPFLGICMGMQVLLDFSEENDGIDCLGLFRGKVRFFGTDLRDAGGQRLKIPHMGWNRIHQRRPHPLWAGIEQDSRFYFVHSYYADPADEALVAGETEYGRRFCSAIATGSLFAIQAHPEKSAAAGLTLLRNFTRWNGSE